MESHAPAEGVSVAGKYQLVRPLARGSMGEVWVARHETLGGELAIKFLSTQHGADGEDEPTAMARFQFEAQVASRLSRKTRHIVSVTDHGEEFGRAYLVMEFVEGESLESWIRRQTIDLPTVAIIVSQIGKGLAQAHAEGLFHRDLKPANILLTRDEDGAILAKILDFGIAKATTRHQIAPPRLDGGARAGVGHATEQGIVLGTPNYMSPEQARGLASLDHRCDVWALSVIAYEALTGQLPYDGETTADLLVNICTKACIDARTFRADLPAAIEPLFEKAFARKVDARFQSALEFAEALDRVAHQSEGAKFDAPAPDRVQPRLASDPPMGKGGLILPGTQRTQRTASVPPPGQASLATDAASARALPMATPATMRATTTDAHAAVPLRGRWIPWVLIAAAAVGVAFVLIKMAASPDSTTTSSASSTSATSAKPTNTVPPPPSWQAVVPVEPSSTASATSTVGKPGKPLKGPPTSTFVAPPTTKPTPSSTQPPPPPPPTTTTTQPPSPSSTVKKPVDKSEVL